MRNKKKIIALAVVLSFAFMLAADVKFVAAQTDTPRTGGTFTLAIISDMKRGFFPATTDEETKQVVGNIYSALIEIGTDLSYVPDLATDWTISADGLTYTFNLHPNATFSDGEPVTSADVKFTILDIMLDYHPAGASAFGVIESIDTPDDHTVVFNLEYAFAPFMNFLGSFHACILPKHLWEGEDPLDSDYYYDPIGSGPFVFEEYAQGEYVILARNPNYWKPGLPYLDKLVFKIISDPNVKMFSLQTRDVDAALLYNDPYLVKDFMVPPASDSFATTFSGQEVMTGVLHVDMNLLREPMSDFNFREALAHALDHNTFLQVANNGFGVTVDTVFPTGIWQNTDTVTTYAYDTALAASLLDAAGYPIVGNWRVDNTTGAETPISIDICSIAAAIDTFKSCELLRDALIGLDIQAQIIGLDSATFTERVFIDHDFDMHVVGWSYQMDPNIGVARFCTGGYSNTGWRNSCGYNNTVVNELFVNASTTVDVEDRAAIFYEIQEILSEELPFIPLYQRASPSVYSREFHNVVTDATDFGAGFEETWWIGGELEGEVELEDAVAQVRQDVADLMGQVGFLTTLAYGLIAITIIMPVVTIVLLRREE